MGNSAVTWEWLWRQTTYRAYQIQKLATCLINLNKLIDAFCMLFAMWRYQHLCGQGDKSVFIRSTKDSKQYNNIQQRVRQGEATWFSSSNKSMEHSLCCPTWPVELQCLKTGGSGVVPPTWLLGFVFKLKDIGDRHYKSKSSNGESADFLPCNMPLWFNSQKASGTL